MFANPDTNPDFVPNPDPDSDLSPKTKPQLETGQATFYESFSFSGAVVFVLVSVSDITSKERSHRKLQSARLLGKLEQ